VLAALRLLLPAILPAVLVALGVYYSDRRREPPLLVVFTFLLGAALGGGTLWLQARAVDWVGLDVRASVVGQGTALLYILCVVAPVREGAKVVAAWPAFRSKYFDEPYDGIVYASAAALGFAACENAVVLFTHPSGFVWILRTLLALPAHVFFASLWGYSLGRSKHGTKTPSNIFPLAWAIATLSHGLYAHFVYGRGPGALAGVFPLLLAMGIVALFAARDLRARGDRPSRDIAETSGDTRLSRLSFDRLSGPPSLTTVRAALRRTNRPVMLRWILFGAMVTLGTMVAGFTASVAFGHWVHMDFSLVDEHDVHTAAPLVVLGVGILSGFPVSGYLIARASNLPGLLEPALATAVAITTTLVLLGFAAPVGLVFGVAFSPVAFALACAGAWVGRPLA
jgi:RsiW-degrading membrane proteinase PrsW (M82 family)